MTAIEKLAEKIASLDVNDPLQLIQIVILQGTIAGMIKSKKRTLECQEKE